MAPASNEEQFKFLISCIRYSNNGKVDFGQVAQECKIVSKGAAAKRYERMMRSHGIAPNAATIKPASSRAPKSERRDSKNHGPKKRKASAFIEDNTADDEEPFSRVKSDPANEKEHLCVKEESGQLTLDEAANLMQYYGTPPYTSQAGEDDVYTSNEYDPNSTRYHTTMAGSYGLQDQQAYEFSFAPAGMNSGSTPLGHGIQYQSMMHYPATDNQGGSESPLIVD